MPDVSAIELLSDEVMKCEAYPALKASELIGRNSVHLP